MRKSVLKRSERHSRIRRKSGSQQSTREGMKWPHDRALTKAKLTDDSLRESEIRYRAIVDNSPDFIGIIQNGILKYVNRSLTETFGWTNVELLLPSFDPIKEAVSERFRETIRRNVERRLNGEDLPPYEVTLKTKNGSEIPVMLRAAKIDFDGKPAIQFAFTDVINQKKNETRLLALHEHASQLSSANDIDTIVARTIDAMSTALRFEHVYFLLVKDHYLQVKGTRGTPFNFTAQSLDGRGLTVKAAKTKQTLRISDTRKESVFVDPKGYDWSGPPTVLSELDVPVIVDGETVAVLCVDSVREDAFTDGDQRLLETLATHVGSSMSRLRREEDIKSERDTAETYLDVSGVIIVALDPHGRVTLLNRKGCEVLGCSAEEALGTTWFDKFLPETERERVKIAFRSLIAGQARPDEYFENPIVTRTGEERWILWHNKVLNDANGNIIGTLSSGNDITERKNAEEKLRQTEENYQSLFDRMLDGVYVSTHAGRFVDVNPAFVKMFGYSTKQEMLNIPNLTKELYFAPEDREDHTLGTGKERVEVFRMRRKDGSEIWVEDYGSYINNERGNIIYHQGILRDVTERKLAQDALRNSEEKYRIIFENSPLGIFRSTLEGRLLEVNPALARMFGYESPETLTHEIDDVSKQLYVHAQDRVKVVAEQLASTDATRHVNHYRRRDGNEFIANLYLKAVRDAAGQPILLEGIVEDATERIRLEEGLRQRAQELDSLQKTLLNITGRLELTQLLNSIVERAAVLLDAPGGGMYLCDSDRQEARAVVSYNTEMNIVGIVLKYGEGTAGVVAQTGKPLIINDYRTWPKRASVYEKDKPFGAVLAAPMIWQGQVLGVLDVLRYEAKPFTETDLQLLMMFANHAAIAVENARLYERLGRHANQLESMVDERTRELGESEERFKEFADLLPMAVFEIDTRGNFTFTNKTANAMTGYSSDEAKGMNALQLIVAEEHEQLTKNISRLLGGAKLSQHEYSVRRKDDSTLPVLITSGPITREGKVVGIRGVGMDITEEKRMQKELAESERLAAIGQTAAMVGHDLRNPLQGIAGALHLLKHEQLTPEERAEMLELIEKSLDYSDSIVRDLSEYSAEISLNLTEIAPESIIQTSIQSVKVPASILVRCFSGQQPLIRVDPDRMRRVFTNLIQNAIDAMPQGGTITIGCEKMDDRVEIDFTDTGPGVPAQVMKNLWKPLQTTKSKGLGLGLAICKRFVDAHGGTISVKIRSGEGTTFKVCLPIKAKAVEVTQK